VDLIDSTLIKPEKVLIVPVLNDDELIEAAGKRTLSYVPFTRSASGQTIKLYAMLSLCFAEKQRANLKYPKLELHPGGECLQAWYKQHSNMEAIAMFIHMNGDIRRILAATYRQDPDMLLDVLLGTAGSGFTQVIIYPERIKEDLAKWLKGELPASRTPFGMVCEAVFGSRESVTADNYVLLSGGNSSTYIDNVYQIFMWSLRGFYSCWLQKEYHPDHRAAEVTCSP
jgi:hypothetical protein